jgi:chemotaxis protein methyltransferase CheR
VTDEVQFRALLTKIERDGAFACAHYKDTCLRRRIAARLRARGIGSYADYARVLDKDAREYDTLIDALTINVTRLFRNGETYAALARSAIPALWAQPGPAINVWSAGCATGDEAYSLAILFHRHATRLGQMARASRVQVLGTDIDRPSLAAAERGAFTEPAFAETPPELRAAYFSHANPARIVPTVRAMVRFERRDLLSDPPPPGQHLICCRNVVIYFQRAAQEELLPRLHAALVPNGYLVLGKVEMLFGAGRALFAPVDARARVFQRI